MRTARTVQEVREAVEKARAGGAKIGLVPTMGFLHEGHLSLVDVARERGCDFVVTSIFVNPKQFGEGEDLDTYPREEERDSALLSARGVDLLFLPTAATIYPDGFSTLVAVSGVSDTLEGDRRPGHFDGVTTVVLKLFNIVRPDIAVFGRKDAQQCEVVSRMVSDLDVPLELAFGETMRESDGLAMSSRNAYLSERERDLAPRFNESLRAGAAAIENGASSTEEIERAMHDSIARFEEFGVDYLRVVDPLTFLSPVDLERDLLVVGAVRIGSTRLIDNIRIERASE